MSEKWIFPSATLAVVLAGGFCSARASVLYSEDFSGATPNEYTYVSASTPADIPGTIFQVVPLPGSGKTLGNIDILGNLNGSFFTCIPAANNNCADLIGQGGAGDAIQTKTSVNLTAGTTYTIAFDYWGTGGSDTTLRVLFGGFSQDIAVGATQGFTVFDANYTPTSDMTGVTLTLGTAATAGNNCCNGPDVDNILVTAQEVPTGTAPEPASIVLSGAAFAVFGSIEISRRRRKRV